jgi:hypothetical protein
MKVEQTLYNVWYVIWLEKESFISPSLVYL